MKNKKLIIAVDGYSSCGKSTFAKAIAEELNYTYIDTGAMYRAVTLFALRNGVFSSGTLSEEKLSGLLDSVKIDFIKNEKTGKSETTLNGEMVEEEIRGITISNYVSSISKIKEVRKKMVDQQRSMSENKGVVMDGRDIGTVVFPDADIKLFMTAGKDIRAKRRYDELKDKGLDVDLSEIKKNIEERDLLDTTREESPLRKAPDAVVLDNSYLTPFEQMIWFKEYFKDKLAQTGNED